MQSAGNLSGVPADLETTFLSNKSVVKRRTLFLPVLMLWLSLTQAADQNDQFAIKGIGLATCTDFVAARKALSSQYFQFGGWLNGYLSASNRYEKDTFDLASWQSTSVLSVWLATFCERNPNIQYVRAVTALINTLGQGRLTARSDSVDFNVGNTTTYIYTSTLQRAQQNLSKLGLYSGTINGALDSDTRNAFKKFQQKEDLEITGLPDQATLAKLFR